MLSYHADELINLPCPAHFADSTYVEPSRTALIVSHADSQPSETQAGSKEKDLSSVVDGYHRLWT